MYEKEKSKLQLMRLSPKEYENMVLKLAKKWKV